MLKAIAIQEEHCQCHQHIPCGHQHGESRLISSIHQFEEEFSAKGVQRGMEESGEEPTLVATLKNSEHKKLEGYVAPDTQHPRQVSTQH